MNNRSVPADLVLPHLVYRDLDEAGAWLTRCFGFREAYRCGTPVSGIQMFLGGAYIMLHGAKEGFDTPAQLGFATQSLTVFVADADAHYRASHTAGARIVEELHETIYGERQYGVLDCDGHRWLFSHHARDVDPEKWGATVNRVDRLGG